MKVLSGHISSETAFIIEDYPYGYNLRCQKRVWLEINDRGTRLCAQTNNPKKNGIWNAVKKSTYSLFGVLLQKELTDGNPDEVGYVTWSGLSMYEVENKGQEWLNVYKDGLTETQIKELNVYLKLIERRKDMKARGDRAEAMTKQTLEPDASLEGIMDKIEPKDDGGEA